MGLMYGVVYLRYKSMIPAMYFLLIIEYSMRMVIKMMKPIVTVTTALGAIDNFIMIPLCDIMSRFSLFESKSHPIS